MGHTKERLKADYRHAAKAYRDRRKDKGLLVVRPSFATSTQKHACLGDCCVTFVYLKTSSGKRLGPGVAVIGYAPTEIYTQIGDEPRLPVETVAAKAKGKARKCS